LVTLPLGGVVAEGSAGDLRERRAETDRLVAKEEEEKARPRLCLSGDPPGVDEGVDRLCSSS